MANENNKNNENKGIEVIEPPKIETIKKSQPPVVNFFKIGTLNVYNQAVRDPLKKRYERFYSNSRKHLWFDLVFLLVIIFLLISNAYILFGPASRFSIQLGNLPVLNINKEKPKEAPKIDVSQELINKNNNIVNLNEELAFKVTYQNKSSVDLSDVDLVSKFSGDTKWQTTYGSLTKKIITLKAGETGENYFKVKIISSGYSAISMQSELKVEWQGAEKQFYADLLNLKLNSDLTLKSFARYYSADGDQLGVGPIPPQVGQPTTFWIFWQINNNLNDLTGLAITGILPDSVSFTGRSSVNFGDQLNYDPLLKKITWQVNNLEKGEKSIQAAMEVEIIPVASQLGTMPVLMNNITLNYKDAFTEQTLEKTSNVITTNLIYDTNFNERGTVQ